MRPPMALRKSPRSTISGSRAAPRIVVRPRASTAALSTFAVPVTVGPRGPPRSIVAPAQSPRGGHDVAMLQPDVGAQGRQAAEVQDRPAGRRCRHPPGSGTTALPRRATSGPSTQKLALMRRHPAVPSTDRRGSTVSSRRPSVLAGDRHAQVPQDMRQRAHVGQSRHAFQPHRAVGQDRRRHHRQGGVLRAADSDRSVERGATGDEEVGHGKGWRSQESGVRSTIYHLPSTSLPSPLRLHDARQPGEVLDRGAELEPRLPPPPGCRTASWIIGLISIEQMPAGRRAARPPAAPAAR